MSSPVLVVVENIPRFCRYRSANICNCSNVPSGTRFPVAAFHVLAAVLRSISPTVSAANAYANNKPELFARRKNPSSVANCGCTGPSSDKGRVAPANNIPHRVPTSAADAVAATANASSILGPYLSMNFLFLKISEALSTRGI